MRHGLPRWQFLAARRATCACSTTNGEFMKNSACCGTVVRRAARAAGVGAGQIEDAVEIGQVLAVDEAIHARGGWKRRLGQLDGAAEHPCVETVGERPAAYRAPLRTPGGGGSSAKAADFLDRPPAFGPVEAGLPVGSGANDLSMQRLQRPIAIQQLASQPVEQLRMAGRLAADAKIAGRQHQRLAKVVHPEAVGDHAPRQWIFGETMAAPDPAGRCRR